MVGSTYNRNVFLIENTGKSSLTGLSNVAAVMEAEAVNAGATRLSIVGQAVVNKGLFSSRVAQRFGFQFNQVSKDTIQFFKDLPNR